MIGQLRGIIIEKQPPAIMLDVQGVGYEVSVPMSTFYRLPELGQEVQLFTHLMVREDAHQLYGFFTQAERKLFRTLIKVNGVGAKLAIGILSGIEPDTFVHCVLNNDTAALVRLPGIGKKTAERLVVEMRDRLIDWYDSDSFTPSATELPAFVTMSAGSLQEAIQALVALGYKPQEASRAVTKTGLSTEAGCEVVIRSALKLMAES